MYHNEKELTPSNLTPLDVELAARSAAITAVRLCRDISHNTGSARGYSVTDNPKMYSNEFVEGFLLAFNENFEGNFVFIFEHQLKQRRKQVALNL